MGLRRISGIVGLAFGLATPAVASAPIEAFGALPSVDFIAVSPDGSRIALAVGDRAGRQIQVRDTSSIKPLTVFSIGTAKVRDLQWAGDHHLLITRSATAEVNGLTGPKREWALVTDINLATHKVTALLGGSIEDHVQTLNTVTGSPDVRVIAGRPIAFLTGISFVSGVGVRTLFRTDLEGHGTRQVAVGNVDTGHWLIDDIGGTVARVDYSQHAGRWILWTKRGDRFVKSVESTDPIDSPTLAGYGRTPGSVMVEMTEGENSIYRELKLGETQLSPPIDALAGTTLVTDPKTGIVIGSHRQDGLRIDYDFLADADQRLWKAVKRAFPDAVIRIVSWSDDRKQLVLQVEGKDVGAAYYLLDVTNHHAAWLANEYTDVQPEDIGERRAITYSAADGLTIPAFLTLPPGRAATGLPLVVLPHGGPGAHDDAGFDWWSQALASRGYAVLQPQFRGSTGISNKFHAAGFGEWGRKMQSDLSDGVAYLAAAKTIDAARVCIVGGSYGGYAALAGVTLQSGVYRCAVSLAGPSDLRAMLAYEQTITGGSRNTTLRFWQRFMGAKSPSDPALDAISPIRFVARADAPILLIHGQDDTVVTFSQSKAMAAALAKAGHPAKLVTLPGEDHWLSRSATRTAMLEATADFLAAHLPAAAATAATDQAGAGRGTQ